MAVSPIFPSLAGFGPSRRTLQLYSRAVTAVPRAYAEPHPRWWHVSLKVQHDGLVSDTVTLPTGETVHYKMDLKRHTILMVRGDEIVRTWDMQAGLSAAALGEEIIAAAERAGLAGGDYGRAKFADDESRPYDPRAIEPFRIALTNATRIFKAHRAQLQGEVGIVQLWPHGFDLSVEWFGDRRVASEEAGETRTLPSQLNLGFYPDEQEDAYFYSNPWPFEAGVLLDQPLPEGARWQVEGWQGSILPYAGLAGDPAAETRLRRYARQVYELARPTLMAGFEDGGSGREEGEE